MLYRIEIENFFSIRDRQVLDLTVDTKVPDPEGRYAPIFKGSELRAPKVIALYGANASGKTTVLRALQFVVMMIRESVSHIYPFKGCDRFNDEESRSRPIRLAIELGGIMDLTPEILAHTEAGNPVEYGLYRYELEISLENGIPSRIMTEALRQKPNGQGKWQRIYERDTLGRVKDSKSFSLSGFQHLVKTLAGHHSVISSFAKFQHPTAQIFLKAAQKAIFAVDPVQTYGDQPVIDYLKAQPEVLSRLNEELNRIDVGVESLRLQESPSGPVPVFKHTGLKAELSWLHESHGTRAFIKMFPLMLQALDSGGIVGLDEMDTAIHPIVLPELIRWFYDKEKRNKFDAQLWLSCHSASLLDDLHKEEIVLCEKDRQGRTRIYSLMDVKVRRDDNHYRKYLSGAYGGVPYLG